MIVYSFLKNVCKCTKCFRRLQLICQFFLQAHADEHISSSFMFFSYIFLFLCGILGLKNRVFSVIILCNSLKSIFFNLFERKIRWVRIGEGPDLNEMKNMGVCMFLYNIFGVFVDFLNLFSVSLFSLIMFYLKARR